ncbi:MAG: entericidin A/B family lipoprotein [Burkholderiales bacterium]|nr:entericidin A/B family lipoprotein [Burkholderiales bacterium]MCE7878311.1 entericidin, EcnA/B family [Betaproteobacteria bacterium PRO3]
MERIVSLVALALFVLTLAGCNTMAGIGKDVKAGGQALETAAEKSKPK